LQTHCAAEYPAAYKAIEQLSAPTPAVQQASALAGGQLIPPPSAAPVAAPSAALAPAPLTEFQRSLLGAVNEAEDLHEPVSGRCHLVQR